MELPPGAPLNKNEIAAEFGVSIAPVGHALVRLAEEGLVEVRPQHGTFVTLLTSSSVREGLFIRLALEIEAVRQAALLRDEALHERLRLNLDQQVAALLDEDLSRLLELDEAMHDAIFETMGHVRVSRFLTTARAQLERMRRLILPIEGLPAIIVQEHRWIVHAIGIGDPELATAAMRAHLNGVSAAFEKHFRLDDR